MLATAGFMLKQFAKHILDYLLPVLGVLMIVSLAVFSEGDKNKFEELHNNWVEAANKTQSPSSSISIYFELQEFKKLMDMRFDAIPFMVESIKRHDGKGNVAYTYEVTIRKMLKMHLLTDTIEDNFPTPGKTFFDSNMRYVEWWEKGRAQTQRQYEILYIQWKQLPQDKRLKRPYVTDDPIKVSVWQNMPEGPEKERKRFYNRTVYQRLIDLGIPALPYAIEKIEQGDTDLIEAINYWTDNALRTSADEHKITAERMPEFCVHWWEENKDHWLLPPVETDQRQ